MAKKAYRLETEWDLGYNDTVFATAKLARKALEDAHAEQMEEGTVQELLDDGLYAIVEVEYTDG